MNLLNYYPHLIGSRGKIHVSLDQAILDRICGLATSFSNGHLDNLGISPRGADTFCIQAELSNAFFHFVGSMGLRSLRQDGINIKITHPTATLEEPIVEGWMDTTIFGKGLVIPKIVAAINSGLGAEVVEITETAWLGWTQHRVFVNLHPFRFLGSILPAGIAPHIIGVQWQAIHGAFIFDLTWHHTGATKISKVTTKTGENQMDDELKAFVDNLIATQFADLKGSWANLHLQLPEKLLNELLGAAIRSQKDSNPWLALICAAHVKGAVSVEVKVSV